MNSPLVFRHGLARPKSHHSLFVMGVP
jgi:hypothetical protein